MPPRTNEQGQPIGDPLPEWTPRPRPPATPMTGRFCRVEPLDPARHAGPLFEALAQPAALPLWTYLPYGPFADPAAFRAWMERTCRGDDPLFHAIADAAGREIGFSAYSRIAPAVGVIEIGHLVFGAAMQRTPVATEALYLMMRRAFDELGYRRCEWKCDTLNEPSRRAAERLGFTFEGIFRKAIVYKQRSRDTAWYAVVDTDWPVLRGAFETWLSPGNFGAEGRQRRSLAAIRAGG